MFDNTRVRLSSLGPLVLRVGLGLGFVTHGWGKMTMLAGGKFPLERMLGTGWLGHSLGATMAVTEFVGGLCVLIGLLTRFWAGGLAIGMVVALSTAHRSDLVKFAGRLWDAVSQLFSSSAAFSEAMSALKLASAELAWTYLAAALAVFLMGPGAFSADFLVGLIVRRRKRNAVVGLGMRYPARMDEDKPEPPAEPAPPCVPSPSRGRGQGEGG